jgi:membrane protein DedA with SNARE-associated domain
MSSDAFSPLILAYRYWILIPLAILEGPSVAFVTAALAARGYFNPYVAFWIFIAKDVVIDGAYYYVGQSAATRRLTSAWLAKAHMTSNIERLRAQWDGHAWRMISVGKFCWGLGPAILATAGIVGVPASSFFVYVASVALLQYSIVFVLGYTFGHAFAAVSTALRTVQIIVAMTVIIAVIFARRRLRASEQRRLG